MCRAIVGCGSALKKIGPQVPALWSNGQKRQNGYRHYIPNARAGI